MRHYDATAHFELPKRSSVQYLRPLPRIQVPQLDLTYCKMLPSGNRLEQ